MDLDFDTFLDGVTQMVLSTKWTDLADYSDEKLPPLHMFLASEEESALLSDQKLLWDDLKDNPARESLVVFESGYHALTGSAPQLTAREAIKALEGKSKGERTVDVRAFQEQFDGSKKK